MNAQVNNIRNEVNQRDEESKAERKKIFLLLADKVDIEEVKRALSDFEQ